MKPEIKTVATSKNGNFKLMAEHDDGRVYWNVRTEDAQRVAINIYIDHTLGGGKKTVRVGVYSLNTGDTTKLREMSAYVREAADFADEIDTIINAK